MDGGSPAESLSRASWQWCRRETGSAEGIARDRGEQTVRATSNPDGKDYCLAAVKTDKVR